MNQMTETIQGRHQEILSGLNALSRAVVADAEGVHSLQLIGFLRHKLLPHMRSEEHHLYDLVDRLVATQSLGVTATMVKDHQFVESQIDSIDECLRTARLDSPQDPESLVLHRKLDTLLARLDAILRSHLQSEEDVYLAMIRHSASHEIESEIQRRMQSVYGEGKTSTSPDR